MKHLANLPLTGAFPASRVYRCYNWNHVAQQVSQKGRHGRRPRSLLQNLPVGGETIANSFEREQTAAKFEGYNAMLLLRAAG
jgi:hypothetical protein